MKACVIFNEVTLDGMMSAAIVKHWWITNHGKHGINEMAFIGYNYGQDIPDLSEYDRVIMVAIRFPEEEMDKLESTKTLIWIDKGYPISHSNNMIDGMRDDVFATCTLTWIYFCEKQTGNMPEIVRLLGLYDSFPLENKDEETKVLQFHYGAKQIISDYDEAYTHLIASLEPDNGIIEDLLYNGAVIYNHLRSEAKQAYKNGFEIEFESVKPPINGFIDPSPLSGLYKYKFICINKEKFNPLEFGINYYDATKSPDGKAYCGVASFYFDGGKYQFHLYSHNDLANCRSIAMLFGGGGLNNSAQFIITQEQFQNLIK